MNTFCSSYSGNICHKLCLGMYGSSFFVFLKLSKCAFNKLCDDWVIVFVVWIYIENPLSNKKTSIRYCLLLPGEQYPLFYGWHALCLFYLYKNFQIYLVFCYGFVYHDSFECHNPSFVAVVLERLMQRMLQRMMMTSSLAVLFSYELYIHVSAQTVVAFCMSNISRDLWGFRWGATWSKATLATWWC